MPLTLGVAIAIVFTVVGIALTTLAYICSIVNDASPDPGAQAGATRAASSARTSMPGLTGLCGGLPGG